MTAPTELIAPAGPTLALSVVATLHAAVAFTFNTPDVANYVALINPGAVAVAVKLSQQGDAATFPVDGTPGDFVLPPLMQDPILMRLPNAVPATATANGRGPFITAIGAAAGPTIIYATPVTFQG